MTSHELLTSTRAPWPAEPPKVPNAPGVDTDSLTAGDDNPLFVTLPVLTVGSRGSNPYPDGKGGTTTLEWSREAVESIRDQIIEQRPEGRFGHLKDPHDYTPGSVRWIGAAMIDDTLYARGYVPVHAAAAREHFRIARAAGAEIGTSIQAAFGEGADTRTLSLVSLDLGNPALVSNESSRSVPEIASETRIVAMSDEQKNGNGAGSGEGAGQPAVLKLVSDTLGLGAEAYADALKLKTRLDELEKRSEEYDSLVKVLDLGDDPQAGALALAERLNDAAAREAVNEVDKIIATETKDRAHLRPYLREFFVRNGKAVTTNMDGVRVRVSELLQSSAIIGLGEGSGRRNLIGDIKHNRNGGGQDKPDNPHSPEAMQESARRIGI